LPNFSIWITNRGQLVNKIFRNNKPTTASRDKPYPGFIKKLY